MASAIDPLKPITGTPTTQSVRDNFSAAKSEIETLQGLHGIADYADTATTGTPISLAANTWTKMTNNGLGTGTDLSALPSGVTNVWNTSTNQLNLDQLPLKSSIIVRIDVTATTTAVNQVVNFGCFFGVGTGSAFDLPMAVPLQFKTAGTYRITFPYFFVVKTLLTQNNPLELKIKTDNTGSCVVNGWLFDLRKAYE